MNTHRQNLQNQPFIFSPVFGCFPLPSFMQRQRSLVVSFSLLIVYVAMLSNMTKQISSLRNSERQTNLCHSGFLWVNFFIVVNLHFVTLVNLYFVTIVRTFTLNLAIAIWVISILASSLFVFSLVFSVSLWVLDQTMVGFHTLQTCMVTYLSLHLRSRTQYFNLIIRIKNFVQFSLLQFISDWLLTGTKYFCSELQLTFTFGSSAFS